MHLNCPLTPETEGLIGPRAVRAHEADRVLHHHRARSGARRGRAARRARRRHASPVPASTSSTTSRPTRRTRCSPSTTSWPARTPPGSRSRRRATSRVRPRSSGSRSSPARCRRACVNPEVWPAYADRFDACFGVRPEELPSVTDQEREGARPARPPGDRRRWPLGRALPDLLRLHRRGRQPRRRRQVPHALRAPLPRVVRAHDRGATAAPAPPPVVLGRARSTCATAPPPRSRASSTTASTTGASTSPSSSPASVSRWAATSPTPS